MYILHLSATLVEGNIDGDALIEGNFEGTILVRGIVEGTKPSTEMGSNSQDLDYELEHSLGLSE